VPAAGDGPVRPSLADLWVHEQGQLKRVVAGMGLGSAEAEDILQDVVVGLAGRDTAFSTPEDAVRWLMRVTVNRCLLEFRRRKRFREVAKKLRRQKAEAGPGPACPDDTAGKREELATMREALRELYTSHLCPLVLRYFCGLDSVQVGAILQLPASTVRSRLREARMTLAKRLMDRGLKP